jgi:hypothetical protein
VGKTIKEENSPQPQPTWPLCSTKHGISTQVEHLKKPLTQKSKINTQVFYVVKTSKREIVHDPNQLDHLRKYINAKEK